MRSAAQKSGCCSITVADYTSDSHPAAFVYTVHGRRTPVPYDPRALDGLLERIHRDVHIDAHALGLALRTALGIPPLREAEGALAIVDMLQGRSIPWEMLVEDEAFWGCRYAVSHDVPSERQGRAEPEPIESLILLEACAHPPQIELDGQAQALAPLQEKVRPPEKGQFFEESRFFEPLVRAASEPFLRRREERDRVHLHGGTATYSQYTLGHEMGAGNSVVLFMGHIAYAADNAPHLVLNASLAEDAPALTDDFGPLLRRQGHAPSLVILCACGPSHRDGRHHAAALAERLIARGARGVVLAEREVESAAARDFVAHFVSHLFADDGCNTVPECLRRAREGFVDEGRTSNTLLAFQYHGDKDLRVRVAGAEAGPKPSVAVKATCAAVLCAALLFSGWFVRPPQQGPDGSQTEWTQTSISSVSSVPARILSAAMDWEGGELTLAFEPGDAPLCAVCLIRVAGRWYIKPAERLVPLRNTPEKILLYRMPSDRNADEVAVYIMLEENANLQDFIDMGQLSLSPPEYVLDGARVAR